MEHRPLTRHSAPRPLRRRVSIIGRVSATVLVLAAPLATWWLVGPNPGSEIEAGPTVPTNTADFDYMFHPPSIDPAVERAVGGGATVAVLVAAIALVFTARSGRIDRRWWLPIVGLVAAGAFAGFGERVVTAAVIGANIGGGLVILFGAPLALALVLGSLVRAIHVLTTTDPVEV